MSAINLMAHSEEQGEKIVHILLGKCNPERLNGVNIAVDHYANNVIVLGIVVYVLCIREFV